MCPTTKREGRGKGRNAFYIAVWDSFLSERPIKKHFLPSSLPSSSGMWTKYNELEFWQKKKWKFPLVKRLFVPSMMINHSRCDFLSIPGCLSFEIIMSCFRLMSPFSTNFHVLDCFLPSLFSSIKSRQSWVKNLREKTFQS